MTFFEFTWHKMLTTPSAVYGDWITAFKEQDIKLLCDRTEKAGLVCGVSALKEYQHRLHHTTDTYWNDPRTGKTLDYPVKFWHWLADEAMEEYFFKDDARTLSLYERIVKVKL